MQIVEQKIKYTQVKKNTKIIVTEKISFRKMEGERLAEKVLILKLICLFFCFMMMMLLFFQWRSDRGNECLFIASNRGLKTSLWTAESTAQREFGTVLEWRQVHFSFLWSLTHDCIEVEDGRWLGIKHAWVRDKN